MFNTNQGDEMTTTKTCDACWHGAPRGSRLIIWRGLADFAISADSPYPSLRNWSLCVRCCVELFGRDSDQAASALKEGYALIK